MNDDIIIPVVGFFVLVALLGGGSNSTEEKVKTKVVQESVKKERSVARDYKASPTVIEGMGNISVIKEKGQASRAIEPNHKVSHLNGLILE